MSLNRHRRCCRKTRRPCLFSLPFDSSVVAGYALPSWSVTDAPRGDATEPPRSSGPGWMRTAGIAKVAAGGAGLVAGGVLGALSLVERSGATPHESQVDAQRRNDRITTFGTGAVIGLAAGAALAASGVALLVLSPPSQKASGVQVRTSARPGGAAIELSGWF